MVKSKPSCPPEGNELNNPNDRNKGWAYNPKKYRSKKHLKKPSPDPEVKTEFKVRYNDLEGCIFELLPRPSDKFSWTMKSLEQYLGEMYSES